MIEDLLYNSIERSLSDASIINTSKNTDGRQFVFDWCYIIRIIYIVSWGNGDQNQSLLMLLAQMKLVKITVLLGTETLSVTVHIKQETQPFEDISAIVAGKRSVIVQILSIITFAKTNLLLI